MEQKYQTDFTVEYDREVLQGLLEEFRPDKRLEGERNETASSTKKLGPLNTDRLATLQALKMM